MRVHKDWFINKSIELYSKKLIESLRDMPEQDFESEYKEKAPIVVDRPSAHSIGSMEGFNGQVKARIAEHIG